MLENAADEVVRHLREAQPARVCLVEKQVRPAGSVGQVVMHVGPRARAARERLGHERGDGPRSLRELAGHHPEERVPVGRRQGVGILEVHLVLVIRVFVVALIDAPAQAVESLVERRRNPKAPEMPL